jgi:eukaryotic-like serine/threonine-protein kinase
LLLSKAEQAGSFLEKTPLQDITVTLTAAQSLLGRQIGPYQIVSPLGAGGMGEVYRAHDSKLGRDVAIKTLPREFARDPERLARFRREARTLASLNHPNIAAIYGLEESGDVDCLVMELVEGETLAARLQKGRLPMAIVLRYGTEVADALAAAHALGIVHRDLKPQNIMITKSGVKVLDFGLAKSPGDETLTASHVVMGTPAYMAPEQGGGKECDARTDIYALGLVLYEMATGTRLPQGQPPSIENLPPQFAHVIERCLKSAPENRWQSASDLKGELEWAGKTPLTKQSTESRKGLRRWIWGVAAGILGLGLVAAGATWFLRPKPEQPLLQVEITPPEGAKLAADTLAPFALSPDGRHIAFTATGKDGRRMLWLRSINSSAAAALAGTENAEAPFWSPDNRWVGFSANSKLQKVDVLAGGQPQVICDIEGRTAGTWNSEGVIVFGQGAKPLQRVSAAGGTPAPILSFDAARQEIYQAAPYFLPDGHHFLYFSLGRKDINTMLASLDGKLNRILMDGTRAAIYAPNPRGGGSIVYHMRGRLLARQFDLDKLEFTGQPAVIADDAENGRSWSASADGLLAFRRLYAAPSQLTWVSRDGHSLSTAGDPGPLSRSGRHGQASASTPRISPDQRTLTFSRDNEQNDDIWTFDLTRNTSTRFTFEWDNTSPIWSSDGKSIVYASNRNAAWVLVERPANGIGPETILTSQQYTDRPTAVSHDGLWLVLMESTPLHSVIALRSRRDPSKVIRIQDHGLELDGSISRDGRWLLYSSVPATRREVLVQSVPKEAGGSPDAVGKWQISTAGGSQPAWRADGKEIFHVAPDGMMMATPVESSENFFRPGTPKALFQTRLDIDPEVRQYDVTADGQRFLLNQRLPDNPDSPITVVFNWPKLLEKGTAGR